MKIFTHGILAKRKIAFIFLLAILLPSIVVGYLSLDAFSNGGEVRQLYQTMGKESILDLNWTPDGRTISLEGIDPESRAGGIYGVDMQTAAVAPIVQVKKGMEIFAHRWSRDGKNSSPALRPLRMT